MKLLQINTTLNTGSTGRIAEEIGLTVMQAGGQSVIAAGYTHRPSQSEVIRIGSAWDRRMHGLVTRLFDKHGFASAGATKRLIKAIELAQPDIIHMHNIHGYYLNVEVLFNYLKKAGKPVVWTLHDCWPFTGHCAHFERVNCYKWQTECNHCPNKRGYTESWLIDNSRKNFYHKKELFNGVENLTIVTPSHWLANHVANSFLSAYPVKLIHNGVDLNMFKPHENTEFVRSKYGLSDKTIVLGVANTWKKKKALQDFISLSYIINKDIQIVLIGMTPEQSKDLPKNIKAISRTENQQELAALYSAAAVFINPTYVDNFPTTNIEALACGTPVITYRTGGSIEAIDENTGLIVEKGDIAGLKAAIEQIVESGKEKYSKACIDRAVKLYNKNDRYKDYITLFDRILNIQINKYSNL
ncbi:MAG: glycosyltransferase [Paludibacter sp.]|nr:glycosyltransferase [Paludibacter sp.]